MHSSSLRIACEWNATNLKFFWYPVVSRFEWNFPGPLLQRILLLNILREGPVDFTPRVRRNAERSSSAVVLRQKYQEGGFGFECNEPFATCLS